jgi:hypothetical protein
VNKERSTPAAKAVVSEDKSYLMTETLPKFLPRNKKYQQKQFKHMK